jgi:20S proteasome subunit alpha 7
LLPDGKTFVERGREEAKRWRQNYKEPIPVDSLSSRLGGYAQIFTLYNSVRPFGISTIIGGVDEDGSHLYMIEPSGTAWGYKGAATGKGRQLAKSELEKLDFENLTAREAVKEAAKIIYLAHEDSKDREFELEISWASISETQGRHEFVPEDLLEEAKQYAIEILSGGDEMEE